MPNRCQNHCVKEKLKCGEPRRREDAKTDAKKIRIKNEKFSDLPLYSLLSPLDFLAQRRVRLRAFAPSRLLFLLLLVVTPTLATTTQPTSGPAAITFRDPGKLLALNYAADWNVTKDPDYVLHLTQGDWLFTLDIPDLPMHIPGMIPLGLVVNGYVDDVKKSHPGAQTKEATAPNILKAKVRSVQSTWNDKVGPVGEFATLIVHGDHVFILRIVAPSSQMTPARKAYDQIIQSLAWQK